MAASLAKIVKGLHSVILLTGSITGGSEQIRTAVEAFAELCLAARPRNLLGVAKVVYSD